MLRLGIQMGKRIAFISDRAKQGEKWAIYIQDAEDGTEAEAITPTDNQRAISKFSFSPDGQSIAFLSADEKTTEQKQQEQEDGDMQVWGQDWQYTRLRIVNMFTKQISSLNVDRNVTGICWSPGRPAARDRNWQNSRPGGAICNRVEYCTGRCNTEHGQRAVPLSRTGERSYMGRWQALLLFRRLLRVQISAGLLFML